MVVTTALEIEKVYMGSVTIVGRNGVEGACNDGDEHRKALIMRRS